MGTRRLVLFELAGFGGERPHVHRLCRLGEGAPRRLDGFYELEQDAVPDFQELDEARGLKPGDHLDVRLADFDKMNID